MKPVWDSNSTCTKIIVRQTELIKIGGQFIVTDFQKIISQNIAIARNTFNNNNNTVFIVNKQLLAIEIVRLGLIHSKEL